jgi:hypothetical protein
MVTGELKVFGSSTQGFDALANGWEFVTFSGNGNVSFQYNVEGSLANGKTNGIVAVDAAVRIYDVTTWTNLSGSPYFFNSFGTQVASPNGSGLSPLPFMVASDFDNQGVRGASAATCASQFINSCTTDSSGTAVSVDLLLDGTLSVQFGRIYLIELMVDTYTFNGGPIGTALQVGDFANTATFSFTNLNRLTYESASEQFLAAEQDVPEPATGALVALGLAGVWWARRRRAATVFPQ